MFVVLEDLVAVEANLDRPHSRDLTSRHRMTVLGGEISGVRGSAG
jgi:hypothetical protein